MTRSTDAVVDAHLARLDASSRRAFVADVWAARGFETRVEGSVVVARRRTESVVVYPLPPSRLRRPASPDRPVDVVVAFDAVSERGTNRGTYRVVTPAGLREMLRYALDPVDADAICRRHLGASRSALSPPLSLRVRAGVDSLRGAETPLDATTVVALLAVFVLVFAGIGTLFSDVPASESSFGAASSLGPASGDETTRTSADDTSSTPASASATSRESPAVGSLDTVPGVGPDGVTNLTALALAHDRALDNRTYTLWTDRYRPQNGVPGAPRTQRDTDIAVEGDRYLVEETFETEGERQLVRVVYFDGSDWYVDDRSTETASVRWINGTNGDVAPNPHLHRERLVERYLATPTTDVTERIYVGRETRYRLEGEGRPSVFPLDQVYNYSFVAFVDERGFVHEATVEFTVVTAEGSYPLRFEWTYGQFDATTVTEPAWLHLARSPTEAATTSSNRTTEAATTPSNRTTEAATTPSNRTTEAATTP